jgi:hypothetical protein
MFEINILRYVTSEVVGRFWKFCDELPVQKLCRCTPKFGSLYTKNNFRVSSSARGVLWTHFPTISARGVAWHRRQSHVTPMVSQNVISLFVPCFQVNRLPKLWYQVSNMHRHGASSTGLPVLDVSHLQTSCLRVGDHKPRPLSAVSFSCCKLRRRPLMLNSGTRIIHWDHHDHIRGRSKIKWSQKKLTPSPPPEKLKNYNFWLHFP